METVESANVLLQSSLPRNWHRKKQCVEARIIETFTKVASRRKNDTQAPREECSKADSVNLLCFAPIPPFMMKTCERDPWNSSAKKSR